MNINLAAAANLLKKLQDDSQKIQEELSNAEIIGSDPQQKIIIKVNGQQEVLSVQISKDAVDPNDIPLLEDLIMFAIQDALKKSKQYAEEKIGSLYQGLPLPAGFKIKF